jgi:general secretion pathway protein B
MSFILDALRKAESERSRNAGPVLMDARMAPPRERLPAWAWVLGGMLLATLLLLTWLLLRKPAALAIAAAPPPAAVVQPAAPALPPAAPVEPALLPDPAVVAPVPAPALAPVPEPAVAQAPAPPVMPPPRAAPAPVYTPPPPRIDNLPTAQDLVAQGVSLPALQLNLHVYDAVPANRYVLLNSRRLREGEEVAEGVRVESITPGGVVLNARGRRFVLLAGG